jgi:hypothetical protein
LPVLYEYPAGPEVADPHMTELFASASGTIVVEFSTRFGQLSLAISSAIDQLP